MKISIIICTYNGEKFLEKTIKSALNQDYSDFEIIIIDDCSHDNTKKILDYYIKFDNIKIHFNKRNHGLGYSRNLALSLSSGNWITFLDHDDLFDYNRLTIMSKIYKKNNNFKFYFHDTHYIDEDDMIIDSHLKHYDIPYPVIYKKKSTTLLLKYGSFIDSEAIFFNRDILKKIGYFDEKLTYLCDYDFFLRVSQFYNLFYSNQRLSSWRVHNDQQQKKNNNQKKERIKLFIKYLFSFKTSIIDKFYCLRTVLINIISMFRDYFR